MISEPDREAMWRWWQSDQRARAISLVRSDLTARMGDLMTAEERQMDEAIVLADDIRALNRLDAHFRALFQREIATSKGERQ